MNSLNKLQRYGGLNGLRTFACIGILLMHVKANVPYKINSTIISNFTNFVFLFMVLSSFSMCCGYFEKIKNNKIDLEKFYSKRFKKVLPFFLTLLVIDVIVEHNLSSLIEAYTNSTLMFGFLQKDLQVLGVAWFLGLVFLFYMIFPFFVYLFSNKKRAWFVTINALLMNFACIYYFNVGRSNMFYSFIFFCIGGLLYLYKDSIINLLKNKRLIGIILLIISTVVYFARQNNKYIFIIQVILFSITWIGYAISFNSKVLDNKITQFIGSISLEIYLSHMFMFRIIEKMKFLNIFSNNYLSYIFTSILVIIGTILFSYCFQFVFIWIKKKVLKNENLVG